MLGKSALMVDIQRTATAAATYVIQAPELKPGQVMIVDCVAYVNETTADKDMTWGFRLGNKDVWVHTIEGAAADLYKTWVGPITLRSENRLIFKVLSPAAGDKTHVTVIGTLIDVCPDEPIAE